MHRYHALFPVALLAACSVFDQPSETEKGYAALAAGDNPAALHWLSIAAKQRPDDPYLMLDLAAANQKLGKFDEARRLYQKVIETAKDVVPDSSVNPALHGRTLGEIAAANLALLPK